ncbi:MAG TPA: hypothetical protein VFK09_11955 [Gemmatimonadales bacterium]|jgi:hypothetical protein|nr:hypothetical protein [Gemmatimonadales bacterium]
MSRRSPTVLASAIVVGVAIAMLYTLLLQVHQLGAGLGAQLGALGR